jgi:hypothetical protein
VGVEPLGQGESAFVQRRLVGAVVLAHLLDGPGVARPQVRQLLVRPMTAVAVRNLFVGLSRCGVCRRRMDSRRRCHWFREFWVAANW